MDLSQFEIIGIVVIGLISILGFTKYITDYTNKQNEAFKALSDKQNEAYSKFNENLTRNTIAIDNLNKCIERMEREFKDSLQQHEQRLNGHDLAISKLERSKE